MNIFNHRRISSRQQQDPLSRRIWNDPYLDWSIMLAVATALVLLAAFMGYRTYSYVLDALEAPIDPVATAQGPALDADNLSKALEDFGGREARRSDIIRGAGIPGDPSI